MGLIARSPIDVMLGEMAFGVSDATRYADLQAIASVISNRSTALGVTPQQVVAKQSEFNAYGKSLPAGASAYRALAEAAWNDIVTNGPTHTGMFYATPAAVGNLPKGLREVTEVEGGHRYFEDPHGRAIKTSLGFKAPTDLAATRAAAAQRVAFETAAINGEDFATPTARPDILQITQNPALLAGVPLSEFDPNISTGVPDMSALTMMPEGALAQQIQPSTPVATQQELAAAASRFGDDPSAMIASPADLQAALSRINTPASNPFDINKAMSDAIASSIDASAASKTGRIGTSVDPARMADNAPLSEADKALQGMMKEAAASEMNDRFAGPARPVTQSVTTTSIPGQVPSDSYVPGSAPMIDVSSVPANRVQSISVQPGETINSPEALAAALGSFPSAMAAQRTQPVSMTDNAAQAAIDSALRGPTPSVNSGTNALQAAVDSAVRGPNASLPSADNALQAAIDAATRGPVASSFSMTNNAAQAAIDGATTGQMPSNAVAAAKTSRLPGTDEAVARDFAAEVQAGLPAQKTEYDRIRSWAATQTPDEATPEEIQNSLVEAGQVPTPTFNPTIAQPAMTATVPALEDVEIAKQPEIAPPAESVIPATKPSTKSMPAVQARQSTAMDVWSGKAQTGIATDGSTVSRISGSKIGRYDPKFDQTMFSIDDGNTWSSPVAGNQLTPTSSTNSQMASIKPTVSQSFLSKLASVLSGTNPASVSPTDVGPPMGLDGGASVGRDGPAGAPGGWGPGGSIGSSGPTGGYGSTRGKDPNGTY